MYKVAAYSHTDAEVKEISDLTQVTSYLNRYAVVWLDIVSPTEKDLDLLGEIFGFHRLALEDCMHTTQRAKIDNYEDHIFLVLKVANYNRKADLYSLSAFVGKNYLVTIREKKDPDV